MHSFIISLHSLKQDKSTQEMNAQYLSSFKHCTPILKPLLITLWYWCTQFPSLLWCLWGTLIKLKGSFICRYFCMPFKDRTNKHRTVAFKQRLLCILKTSIYSFLAPGNRPWGFYLQVPSWLLSPFGTGLSIVGLFPCEISLILFSVLCSQAFTLQDNRIVRRQKKKWIMHWGKKKNLYLVRKSRMTDVPLFT